MTSVTVQLSEGEIRALKDWAGRANPRRALSELRAALKQSLKEESAGKGRRFRSGREAIRWLES